MSPTAKFLRRAHGGFNWADRDPWMVSDRSLKLARHDAQVRRFMTVPGVGATTS